MSKKQKLFEIHPVVFPVSALLIVVFVLWGVFDTSGVRATFNALQGWIVNRFGWLYILAMSGFLVFALFLCFSRFGKIRLGKDGEKPEFSTLAWFSMLFSAGMGIGLLFWSVAEPIYHYNDPPASRGGDLDAAREAMGLTIFHWGLHPWSLYALVALSLAYFGFRRGLPLSFRSVFYPLIGERIHGRLGDAIDIIAVCATLFGVATSLGLGAMQVNAGLNHLMGVPQTQFVQVLLIAGITAVATCSVVLGLHTGIRRLSEANIILATCLLVFVFLLGPTHFLLNAFVENMGSYLQKLPVNSFWTGAFEEKSHQGWLGNWTIFYWGWWIAWSPFVGMFIARVSRGRTIREFITGVLIVPTAVSILWLTVFGNSALHQDLNQDVTAYENIEYPVQVQGRFGFPVAKDGSLVAPTGQRLRINDEGKLTLLETGEVVSYQPKTKKFTDTDGEVINLPKQGFEGEYRARYEALTVVEYLQQPILNADNSRVLATVDTALFVMLGHLPWKAITATVATLCIILFFVTSSDSASMVIDIISSGGNEDPPVGTRLFWAITEGIVAATLLVAGGLKALQTASITAALPFSVIIILMCVSLFLGLRREEAGLIPHGQKNHIKNQTNNRRRRRRKSSGKKQGQGQGQSQRNKVKGVEHTPKPAE